MRDGPGHELADILEPIASQRLPRWHELPDFALYMDQVLALIDRHLGGYPGFEEKGLTASMVNNYVKLGVMPPPVKKKYDRTHLACLIMICILKASLPIAAIQRLIAHERETASEEQVYDAFCGMFEAANTAAAADASGPRGEQSPMALIYHAALRARAEQTLASKLFDAQFPGG